MKNGRTPSANMDGFTHLLKMVKVQSFIVLPGGCMPALQEAKIESSRTRRARQHAVAGRQRSPRRDQSGTSKDIAPDPLPRLWLREVYLRFILGSGWMKPKVM